MGIVTPAVQVQTIRQLEKAGPLSIEVMVYVLALCIEVNRARWKEIETLLLGIFIGLPRLIFAVKSWFRHSETLSGFVLSDFYS
jgi:hypothetical protein